MKKILLGIPALFAMTNLLAEDASPVRQSNPYQMLIIIGLALLFFYFILWRPEQKKRKVQLQQRESMKKGDKVTAMGIIGTVDLIKENTVILKMFDGSSKVEFLKAAITDVQPSQEVLSEKQ